MRLCELLLEMEPKVLTTKEEDQEQLRQDFLNKKYRIILRTVNIVDMELILNG